MAEFRIKIAGYTAAVCSLFESTRDYCSRYLTGDTPDFEVSVSQEDLTFEQAALDAKAEEEGLRRRIFTAPFLERAAIQRKVAEHLLKSDVLLFHGSAVAVDGKGYIFTAACGSGKSTHTRLWRQVFGDRAIMINDDKPFLRFTEEGVFVCGAPWSGKHGLDTNICVPLQGICILERGQENRIVPVSAEEARDFLIHQCQAPAESGNLPQFHRLTERLPANTPLFCMQCNTDLQAAEVSYHAMCK